MVSEYKIRITFLSKNVVVEKDGHEIWINRLGRFDKILTELLSLLEEEAPNNNLMPVGTVMPFTGGILPPSWTWMEGQYFDERTMPELYKETTKEIILSGKTLYEVWGGRIPYYIHPWTGFPAIIKFQLDHEHIEK